MLFLSHAVGADCNLQGISQKGGVLEAVLLSAADPQYVELRIILTCKSVAAALHFSSLCGCNFNKVQREPSQAQLLGPSGPWASPESSSSPGPAVIRVHL